MIVTMLSYTHKKCLSQLLLQTIKMLDTMLVTMSHIIQKIDQRIDVVRHKCKSLTQIITDQSEALELRGA